MAHLYILAASLLALFLTWRFAFDPLRNVPGPFLARFTRLWEIFQMSKGNFQEINVKLHGKYGPVVRLGPNRVSLQGDGVVKQLYGHGNKFIKTDFYAPFGLADHPNLFSERNERAHAEARRKVASLYSVSTLLSYEAHVDRCTSKFCDVLRHRAASHQLLEVPIWMQYYAFDVIGEITVGASFGMMELGEDKDGILAAVHDGTSYGAYVGLLNGELHPIITWISEKLSIKNPVLPILDFVNREIANKATKQAAAGQPQDFLDKLDRLQSEGRIDEWDLINTMSANIAAGSDTTAISLSSAVYHLMRSPSCMSRLEQEIDDFAAQGKLSDPATYKEAQQMPYLQAVIKEALRINPATGQIHARVVPEGGATILDQYFPEGTHVGVNPYVVHSDTNIWGKDAGEFRPERWLDAKASGTMEQNFVAFGVGSRTCIGKNISLLEMSKVLPQLFRQYRFVPEHAGILVERKQSNNWFVKPSFKARIEKR